MSDDEVKSTARIMNAMDFTDIYEGVSGGYCVENAKELLMDQYKHLL